MQKIIRAFTIAISVLILMTACSTDTIDNKNSGSGETPAPKHFDLSEYSLSGSNALYDITPLMRDMDMLMCRVGFANDNTIVAINMSMDGRSYMIRALDLTTGDIKDTVGSFASSKEGVHHAKGESGIDVLSFEPLTFVDNRNGILYVFNPDYSVKSMTSLDSLAEYSIDSYNANGALFLFDNVTDTLYFADTDNDKLTEEFKIDWRYSDVSLLSVTSDKQYATFGATDSYTQMQCTVIADIKNDRIIGINDKKIYISNTENGYVCCLTDYDSQGNSCYVEMANLNSDLTYESGIAFNHNDGNVGSIRIRAKRTVYSIVGNDGVANVYYVNHGENTLNHINCADIPMINDALYVEPIIECAVSNDKKAIIALTDGVELLRVYISETESADNINTSIGDDINLLKITSRQPDFKYSGFDEVIKSIENRYGISVLVGKNATLPLPTYDGSVTEDRESINRGLELASYALSKYPDDFFDKLCRVYLKDIVIEFTGNLTSNDDDYFDYPGAFTCEFDESRVIAFDLNVISEETIHHELSHIIDSVLDKTAEAMSETWSSEGWDALNPSDFYYYNAYLDENGNEYSVVAPPNYTAEEYYQSGEVDNVYFVDGYSKTKATEDRARLFENIMSDYTAEFMHSKRIKAKLEYYFNAIRELIDTDNAWQETHWERRLNDIG